MNKMRAIYILKTWDKKGKFVFTKNELHKLFSDDTDKTLSESLTRLVKSKILERVCRGIYINSHASSINGYTIEHIAKALRQGEYNYVSLESMLSEYGVISQIPIDRLTVITTGREGVYKTVYGVIEFTHTKRSIANIISSIQKIEKRPLRIATKKTAWRDLKRVGRNMHLVNKEELND